MRKIGSLNRNSQKALDDIKDLIASQPDERKRTLNELVNAMLEGQGKSRNDFKARSVMLGKLHYFIKRLERDGEIEHKKLRNANIYSIVKVSRKNKAATVKAGSELERPTLMMANA